MQITIRRAALAVLLVMMAACTKVPPGYVAIVVNNYGSQRGVKDFPIQVGTVWYNPMREDVYQFPTYQQNVVWTKSGKEGSQDDESFTVNSVEGATVNFDTQVSVQFEADSVPKVFVKFRRDEDHIMQVYVRSMVRDAFSRTASQMKVVDIFGAGKRDLQDSSLALVRRELDPQGIRVTQLSMIGEVRVDDAVKGSINAVLTAAQRSIAAENKVAQAKAEAEQAMQTARGDSAASVIRAEGQSHANSLLQASLSPAVLQQKAIDRWDGKLPTVTSGATPMINIPKP
jgi:regulator of protease activity HflC (stomatin/prohibitin superfamily)